MRACRRRRRHLMQEHFTSTGVSVKTTLQKPELGHHMRLRTPSIVRMESDSCDSLPELMEILKPRSHEHTGELTSLRRSPRKPTFTRSHPTERVGANLAEKRTVKPKSPRRKIAEPSRSNNKLYPVSASNLFDNLPLLPRKTTTTIDVATSNNKSSPISAYRPVKIPHVDSLLLPLSRITLRKEDSDKVENRTVTKTGTTRKLGRNDTSPMSLMTEAARQPQVKAHSKSSKRVLPQASRFVLNEARCNDDEEDSGREEEESDEDTDLSGFVVDDDAELSYHDASASDSDEQPKSKTPTPTSPRTRRRLFRGRKPVPNRVSDEGHMITDKENRPSDDSTEEFAKLRTDNDDPKHKNVHKVEVIDLTSSPDKPNLPATPARIPQRNEKIQQAVDTTNLAHEFETLLRLNPSCETAPAILADNLSLSVSMTRPEYGPRRSSGQLHEVDRPVTPTVTPPVSPTKLKSPTKLLSPSKRGNHIHRSPHRQSTNAFWDLQTINEWTDQYSPKKAPIASPRKGLSRFEIWSDSESEMDEGVDDSQPLPSPCSSPRKGRSPMKSPEKTERLRKAEEKRRLATQKKAFVISRERLAQDLLYELDEKVTGGQLSKLSASTGGVKVVWSKTLRSTAGRANWRRTVTKPSGSPVKNGVVEGSNVRVQHFASIELADKVIDCDDRLVNTLAHEFCHLANFMVSGVRDQPHGTSFKNWATKSTKHLRSSENPVWQKVEVTTKHNYIINHKYLWACIGREATKAMEFLNLDDADGCGAEYGRHSKSIDVEKHRCGRCKGKLIQVRPKPRASPVKKTPARISKTKSSQSSGDSGVSALGEMVDIIELSD